MVGLGFPLPTQDRVTSSPLCASYKPLLGVFVMLGGSAKKNSVYNFASMNKAKLKSKEIFINFLA